MLFSGRGAVVFRKSGPMDYDALKLFSSRKKVPAFENIGTRTWQF